MRDNSHPDSGDSLQDFVRALGESLYNEPADGALPMASRDAEEVIRAQLTEKTGTHFLDSGGESGRHWQQNKDTPPWEQPAWDVHDGYVIHNVADHMERVFTRDYACVALESALYAYGHTGDRTSDAWLTSMQGFADALLSTEMTHPLLKEELLLPDEFVWKVLDVQDELRPSGRVGPSTEDPGSFTVNTYNGEFHDLSQVLQMTSLGGPHADYYLVQVHQGADVRGGYTAPRVYKAREYPIPSELWYHCEQCGWDEAESCVYGDDSLLYQSTVDAFELEEKGWMVEDEDADFPGLEAAHDADSIDGAVFHRCREEPGHFGHVTFM